MTQRLDDARNWTTEAEKARFMAPGLSARTVDLTTLSVGDSLLLEDGQLLEVAELQRETEWDVPPSWADPYGKARTRYWRVTFSKPLRSGAFIVDFTDAGETHYEPPGRAARVKAIVRPSRP